MIKSHTFLILLFLFVSSLAPPLYAQIPESRTTDWSMAGVKGGIPTGWGEIKATDYGIVADGRTDNTKAINTLINSSASYNKVIKFPSGTIRCEGLLEFPVSGHRVIRGTLSGSGEKLTKFIFNTGSIGGNTGNFNVESGYNVGKEIVVSSGYAKGSNQLTLASTDEISAGDYVELRQDNDMAVMDSYHNINMDDTWAARNIGQLFQVTAVNSSSRIITLSTPLRLTYRAGLNPRIQEIKVTERVGFEDFYTENLRTGNKCNFYFEMAANCWIKNVHSFKTVTAHVNILQSLNLTVRESFFDHSWEHGSGGKGYGVVAASRTVDCLIENNEFTRLRHAMMTKQASSGNVFGYNYSHDHINIYKATNPTVDISIHGHYSYMNLFEGNSVEWIHSADWWGPSGPGTTFFRNKVVWWDIYLDDNSQEQNVVGNELSNTSKVIRVHSTVKNPFIHGNVVGNNVSWDQNSGQDNVRASYYLNSKPAFLSSGDSWPLYGPKASAGPVVAKAETEEVVNGKVLWEAWKNISGEDLTKVPFGQEPDEKKFLEHFEGPVNHADNYGSRLSGILTAPTTGKYTFYIAADNKAELWLGEGENAIGMKKIAEVTAYTSSRQWDKYASQKSVVINLEGGKKYTIQAMHKEGAGGDHIAAGWMLADGTLERPIPGNRFSESTPVAPPPAEEVPETGSSSATAGKITRELWSDITGKYVSDIPLSIAPGSITYLENFEGPSTAGDQYGDRISGFITAPATGSYTFWISGDDRAELWLSTSSDPALKKKIASVPSCTSPRQWTRYAEQKSVAIQLEEGKQYYIESLHKEGAGGDHIAVGWQLADGTLERPILGKRFSADTPPVTKEPVAIDPDAGKIKRDLWSNVSGNYVSNIPLNQAPGSTTYLENFEGPSTAGDNYGDRISGLITAPATGSYTFWIAGDDRAELWLSSSTDPARKVKIATVPAWTSARQWTKYPEQKSVAIQLEAGKQYYIESLHKEGAGGDHIAVGWQLADGTLERPISGKRFMTPFSSAVALNGNADKGKMDLIVSENQSAQLYPNPVENKLYLVPGEFGGEEVQWSIFNIQGLRYFGGEQTFHEGNNQPLEIDLQGKGMAPGLYIMKIQSGDKEQVIKFIKVS